ncbi:thiol-disulfide oxidoreductase DCC family protein [Sediminibacterium soli]|uniref:thiol-disulfide oxidoreductase DCC family protein n=1 Tax=Sediminibacterium soli TaxID=2698829 RepID=UPI001F24AE30|nr:DCC1-like thiol-disulfide oxidoreductase family protein [Sediminibacterium soli]
MFDGVCNLCSRSVQFVIKHDPQHHFRFASFQGVYGQQVLEKYRPRAGNNSFLLLEGEHLYTRSTAALRVLRKLNGLWPVLYVCILIPPFLRDAVYDLVAAKRYRWFGRKTSCWVPARELRELFLD